MNTPADEPRCSHSYYRSPTFSGRNRTQDGVNRAGMSRGERLFWGHLLVWAALVIAADGLDLLPDVGSADGWNWFFLGAGVLSGVGCVRDLLARPRRALDFWDWAIAAGMIVVGLDGFTSGWIAMSIMALLLGALVLIAGERRTSPTAT
jgi:hypothetical protein